MFLVFLVQFTIGFSYIIKIYSQYQDISSIQLALTFLFLNTSIFLGLFWFDIHTVSFEIASIIFKISIITLFLMALVICSILDKSFYNLQTRVFSKLCFTIYCVCIGLVISDIVTGNNTFFYLYSYKNTFFPYYNMTASLLTIFGNLFLLLTFYYSYTSLKYFSKVLIDKKIFLIIFIATMMVLFAFVADFILQILDINYIIIFESYINFVYFVLLNFISIILAYFSYTQPYLHFSGGPRSNLLIEKGFIGYYLASLTDNGPEPLNYSKQFVEYSNMPLKSIIGLAISAISIVGMFTGEREASFSSKVSLIPIPGIENYSALTYTFFTRNMTLLDERNREHDPTVYCILFPSNLTLALRKMNSTLEDVLKVAEQFSTIETLNDDKVLISLSSNVLRKILL